MQTSTKSLKIAFDNGGGVTLFGRNYAHSYDDGKQLARDVISLLAGSDVRHWDGNDDDIRRGMKEEDLSRYEAVYTLPEIAHLLANAKIEVDEDDVYVRDGSRRGNNPLSGHTEREFFRSVSAC